MYIRYILYCTPNCTSGECKKRRRRNAEKAKTELAVFKGIAFSIVKDFIRDEKLTPLIAKFNVNSRVVATNNSDVKISTVFGLGFMFCHSFITG